jgi:hypothetical protein
MKGQKSDGHEARHYRPKLALLLVAFAPLATASDRLEVEMVSSPAAEESLTPFLAASSDRLYLSWLERREGGHRFLVASFDGTGFAAPVEIRDSDRFFANWADFGSVLPFGDGRLAAHWLEKAGSGSYDYDVWVSISDDSGKSFGAPRKLHRDDKLGEHGFVSLAARGDGFDAVWLDGRNFEKDAADNEMALFFTTYDGSSWTEETLLDSRVCECCQTAMAATGNSVFIAYRDRSPEEIRDISVLRSEEGKWTEPRTIHPDSWHLAGCPVNGPQASASGNRLALAWFSASNEDPRVQLVLSENGGESFGSPVRVDEGGAIGRVDVELAGDDPVVVWLDKGGAVRARRVASSGELSESIVVAQTGSDRASGFPRIAVFRGDVYVAWTESYKRPGPSRVHLARLVLR